MAKVYRLFRANPVPIEGAAVERSIERPMLDWDDKARAQADHTSESQVIRDALDAYLASAE